MGWKNCKDKSKVIISNLDPKKRPVSAVADNYEIRNVKVVVRVQGKLNLVCFMTRIAAYIKIKLELRRETI